jgi:hypothetical protein
MAKSATADFAARLTWTRFSLAILAEYGGAAARRRPWRRAFVRRRPAHDHCASLKRARLEGKLSIRAGRVPGKLMERPMSALDDLSAAFNDVKSAVALGVDKIKRLAGDLAAAHVASDTAAIEQIASDLHATADQLRAVVAPPAEPAPPAV